MKRKIIASSDTDYSNEEISIIQKNLDKIKSDIFVYRDHSKDMEVLLIALAPIELSTEKVVEIVGEAYITGVSS
jgi:uncharacterized protein YdeI (BOF family)